MLKASIGLNNLHILLPMVTTVSEVEEVLYLLERDWIAVQEEEQVKITKPKSGLWLRYRVYYYKLMNSPNLSISSRLVQMT